MSDIRKFSVVPTSRLHLRNAADELMYADSEDGTPDLTKPMAVTLYGPGSKQFSAAQSANQNRMIDKLKRKGKTDQTEEEKAQETANWLASCTHSFENVEYDGLQGDALAKAVYSDLSIGFIAEQVNKHIVDWANFTKASTKS